MYHDHNFNVCANRTITKKTHFFLSLIPIECNISSSRTGICLFLVWFCILKCFICCSFSQHKEQELPYDKYLLNEKVHQLNFNIFPSVNATETNCFFILRLFIVCIGSFEVLSMYPAFVLYRPVKF
jgi:hypothetical protein